MPKNRMEDLRTHLFETLQALRDKDNPMDIERAKAVAEVAGVIIKSAAVEVAFIKATGRDPENDLMSATTPAPTLEAPQPSAIAATNGKNGTGQIAAAQVGNKPNGHGVRCDQCPETFENARELGLHKTKTHFGEASITRSQLAGA